MSSPIAAQEPAAAIERLFPDAERMGRVAQQWSAVAAFNRMWLLTTEVC
jgi:hypothetical protein